MTPLSKDGNVSRMFFKVNLLPFKTCIYNYEITHIIFDEMRLIVFERCILGLHLE
jgi:hypothetical protein